MIKDKHVLHILTSQSWGGLELYVVTQVKKYMELGHKSCIYCIENSKIDKEAQKIGIPILYAKDNKRISFKNIFQVKKIIQNHNFQIIHTHTAQDVWLGAFVKLQNKIKLIHGLYMSAHSKKDIIHRFIYGQIDLIYSSSMILNENIKNNYPISENKIQLLRYGRDQNNFIKNEDEILFCRKLWNTKPKDLVFATMCRLDNAKGVKEIAQSFLLLSSTTKEKIKIWIIGEPTLLYLDKLGNPVYEKQSIETFQWLKNFAQLNNNCLELIPFQKNYKPYLDAIDVFILATYKETYSLSVLDAMASGIPVIGTNSGGTPEQIEHLNRGYIVEPKSAQSISLAIEYYVQNKHKIIEHGKLAKSWVEQEHNWKNTLNKLETFYQKGF